MTNPLLSQAMVPLTVEISAVDECGRISRIQIPAERSLTLYLDERELVTLMTMGAYPEALALGYLRNQRLINSLAEIASIQVDWDKGIAQVRTCESVSDIEERTAHRIVTTGCGQGTVFGKLIDEMEAITLSQNTNASQKIIYDIVDAIRGQQAIYKQARSVHACALFSLEGELLYFVEDIGRHNAVDVIAGRMCLDNVDGSNKIFYTTGRLTFEMVMKGAQMGIPFLLSRSGATQMGCQIAEQAGISLLIRCSGEHFLILTHPDHVVLDAIR